MTRSSLLLSILLTMLLSLSLTLTAFAIISDRMNTRHLIPVFEAMDQLEMESARTSLSQGGRPALAAYMTTLDRNFGPNHYLAWADGTDIVSGLSLGHLLPPSAKDRSRGVVQGRFVVTRRSEDGLFWLISVGARRQEGWPLTPYAWVAAAVAALLSLAAAFGIVAPIRQVTRTVQRFGQGDLSQRSRSRRRDEIGALARSFDDMADRIERLVTSERRFLQDVSHELRSPLARLKLGVKLARTGADKAACLDRIEHEVDRLTLITAELVEMARADGEIRAPSRVSTALASLIAASINDCTFVGAARVSCTIAPDLLVWCDRQLLRSAIDNILSNALRYAPTGSVVEISAQRQASAVTISVRDYGPGVPEAVLDQIFSPFFRVEEDRAEASGGVGLGLAIARSAVHRHGGGLTAHNASPGLRIDLTLPDQRLSPPSD